MKQLSIWLAGRGGAAGKKTVCAPSPLTSSRRAQSPACVNDDFAEALGEFHYETVEACAFEDFCSRRPASRRSNVIDDYLDQRGWKASIQARDYLRALRGSVMSLYEVVEVKPDRGLVLRDLVRGGEPVEVDGEQLAASRSAAIWDRIAALKALIYRRLPLSLRRGP